MERPSIPAPQLSQLSACIAVWLGLHFPPERWPDLEHRLWPITREFGFQDPASCIQWLVSAPLTRNQLELLASHLTVGETYFFRERNIFEILATHILPEVVRYRRGTDTYLRIWSAGCCTGEEPYSIAISITRAIPDWQDWRLTLLATDVNPRFLQQATRGVYKEWAFRTALPNIKERFFTKTQDGRFAIVPMIQKMVTFSSLNLAEDVYPSLVNNTNAMDVIFCRNVLMYFTPEQAKQCIHHLYHALVEGGWLIVSPSETSHVLFSQFTTVNFPGAILYRKPRMGETVNERTGERESGRAGEWGSNVADSPIRRFPDSVFPGEIEQPKSREPQLTPYQEAVALYEQGSFAAAAEKAEAWLLQHQADAKAMTLLARVYANQGNLAEALLWCERALATDKLNPLCHYLLAVILQERGQVEDAVPSLKRALYLDHDFVLAHFTLAMLTQRQGKHKEAAKHRANALRLLQQYSPEDLLPEADGMTAGRLMDIMRMIPLGD